MLEQKPCILVEAICYAFRRTRKWDKLVLSKITSHQLFDPPAIVSYVDVPDMCNHKPERGPPSAGYVLRRFLEGAITPADLYWWGSVVLESPYPKKKNKTYLFRFYYNKNMITSK